LEAGALMGQAKENKNQTQSRRVLGVDPGIANTGLTVVSVSVSRYTIGEMKLVKTKSSDATGARLAQIESVLQALLSAGDIDAIAIERVYHNKNITSSLSTGAVIGLVELTAHKAGLPVHLLTPQQIKAVSGLGTAIDKAQVKQIASRLFGEDIPSHHLADAALCGLAGCLLLRGARVSDIQKTEMQHRTDAKDAS